jgi:hypothetical protein
MRTRIHAEEPSSVPDLPKYAECKQDTTTIRDENRNHLI